MQLEALRGARHEGVHRAAQPAAPERLLSAARTQDLLCLRDGATRRGAQVSQNRRRRRRGALRRRGGSSLGGAARGSRGGRAL